MNTNGVIRVIRLIGDSDIVRKFVGGAYAHAFAQHTTKAGSVGLPLTNYGRNTGEGGG